MMGGDRVGVPETQIAAATETLQDRINVDCPIGKAPLHATRDPPTSFARGKRRPWSQLLVNRSK